MDINEFVKKFAEQFEDTDEELFTPDLAFQELDEWSSLSALSIMAMVRTSYGKKITAHDIRTCPTVRDLYLLVESK